MTLTALFNIRITVKFTIHIHQSLFYGKEITVENAHPIVCDKQTKPKVEIPSKHRTKVGIQETNADEDLSSMP